MAEAKYFVVTPHMDDDDLDPFEYRLLGHIRRRAGAGDDSVCYSQISTLAHDTKMCHHKVRDTLKRLKRKHRIHLRKQTGKTHQIVPIDIMEKNIQRYASTPSKSGRPSRNGMGATPSRNGMAPLQDVEATPSRNGMAPLQEIEHKEETPKKKPLRNNPPKNLEAGGIPSEKRIQGENNEHTISDEEANRRLAFLTSKSVNEELARQCAVMLTMPAIMKTWNEVVNTQRVGGRPVKSRPALFAHRLKALWEATLAGNPKPHTSRPNECPETLTL